MKLSGDTIRKMLLNGELIRDGQSLVDHVGPNSLDVTLGSGFKRIAMPKGGVLELDGPVEYEDIPALDDGSVILSAHSFILGTTQEYIELPSDISADIDGRSGSARRGLIVQTAGIINAGMRGNITLEISNLSDYPIRLRPGQSVAQIEFTRLDVATSRPYEGNYQGQEGTTGSHAR